MIVLATGYRLHYPFVDRTLLNWDGMAPDLYLNIFTADPDLFVLGMIEASGIGWQGRYEQAELVASYLTRPHHRPGPGGGVRAAGGRAAAGPLGRLPLPRAGTHVLLRQQGRLPPGGARRDRGAGGAPVNVMLTDVDNITIAFDDSSLTTLKIVIGAILFGIALDTTLEDFARALRRPGTIAIGVLAQFLLLPALTFVLTLVLDVRGSVALGMILVACCPPGNVSNILTHRAGGDVALSVSMTAVSNVLAIFLMPLNMAFWGGLHPTGHKLLEDIDLSALDMLGEIAFVIGVPFALGLTIARFWPRAAAIGHRVDRAGLVPRRSPR